MRSTFKILFYINRGKVKKDGTTAIFCRITVDGEQTVITTGIFCNPNDWKSKKGEVKDEKANSQLKSFRLRIEQTYENTLKKYGVVSVDLLKNAILEIHTVHIMLLLAGEAERERLRVRSLEINSTSTYRQSKISQNNLREYLLTLKIYYQKSCLECPTIFIGFSFHDFGGSNIFSN